MIPQQTWDLFNDLGTVPLFIDLDNKYRKDTIPFWFAEILQGVTNLYFNAAPFSPMRLNDDIITIDFPLVNISSTSTHRFSKTVDCTHFQYCDLPNLLSIFCRFPWPSLKKKFPAAPLNEFRGFLL